MRSRSFLIPGLLALLLPGCVSRGDDWPMWGGTPARNMYSGAKAPPTDWDAENHTNIKWIAQLGSTSFGNPIVCDGVIYLGTNNEAHRDPANVNNDAGVLMAFRESTGQFLWQRTCPKLASGRANDWPGQGVCSSPCVEADSHRLWYCTNRAEIVCLDVRNQGQPNGPRVIWSVDMIKEWGVYPHNLTQCAPVVWGPYVYVITPNGVNETHREVPAPHAPDIVCLDKETGALIWSDNSPGDRILHGQWASPAVARIGGEDVVIAPLGDSWVYGYQAKTGKILWRFDANPKNSVYPWTRNEILATPVIFENRMYLGTGQEHEHGEGPGIFWCVDVTKRGDLSAELPAPVPPPAPPPAEGLGVEPPAGAPNPNSGVVWKCSTIGPGPRADNHKYQPANRMNRTISTAAIDPATGLLFIPDLSGFVHCLDARSGKQYWAHDVETPTWGSPLVCDGKVFVGSEDGFVRIFAVDRQEKLIGERDMGGSPLYSTPVYANGVLYLMTRDRLFAISKPAPAGKN